MDYCLCLKLKQNEIIALSELDDDVLSAITPLFDIPRPKECTAEQVGERVRIGKDKLERYWTKEKEFYLDVYDLPSDLRISGQSVYSYTLGELKGFNIIPVVGLNRDMEHLKAASAFLKRSGKKYAGFRVVSEDVESFELVAEDLVALVKELSVDAIDLICDGRYLTRDVGGLAKDVALFVQKASKALPIRKVVITGSSLSPVISDHVETNEEETVLRKEWRVFLELRKKYPGVIYGDYGIVSPDYSDIEIEPYLFQNLSTPKVFYTEGDVVHVFRGGSMKTHPRKRKQYFDIAKKIVAAEYYRGPDYSAGDEFIFEKSQENGSPSSQGNWLKVCINCHATYVIRDLL